MVCRNLDRNRREICCWFIYILTILCLLGYAARLSLTPKSPRFRISVLDTRTEKEEKGEMTDAQFPTLNPGNYLTDRNMSVPNNSLIFNIKVSNPNKRMGVYYSGINLELYSGGGIAGTNSTPAFYQGQRETSSVRLVIRANQEFWQRTSGQDIVEFMIRVETAVRFRIIRWKTKLRQIEHEAYFSNVKISPNGTVSVGNYTELKKETKVKT